jgi:hypothetical protein
MPDSLYLISGIILITALLTISVTYFFFLTKSLIDACQKNRKVWIILLTLSYFATIIGFLIFLYYLLEVKKQKVEVVKDKRSFGNNVLYALNKQKLVFGTVFVVSLAYLLILAIKEHSLDSIPAIISSSLIMMYAVYFSFLLFLVLYIPKLFYLAKVKKTQRWIVITLSTLPEYVRWHMILLFLAAVLEISGFYYIQSTITNYVYPLAIVIAAVFGITYKK